MITTARRAVTAVTVAAAGLLVGCGPIPEPDPEVVGVVITPVTGAPELAGAVIDAELERLDAEGDRLVVVVADGAPFVAIDFTVPALPGNSDDREEELTRVHAQMATAIAEQRAVTPEIDVTEAVSLLARAATPDSRMTMLLTGSGLQTVGALQMLGGRLHAEPADLVTAAEQQGQVPDLRAVAEVRMPRLGVTTAPQPDLDEQARIALSAIWSEYWARTGARSVDLNPVDLRAGSEVTGAPTVSAVPIDRPIAPPAAHCTQVLGTSTVGFGADSAELVDPAATAALIDEVRTRLAECEGPWIVEGSASSEGDPTHNRDLSLARAERIAAMLRAALPDAEIQTTGWGDQWACRTPDLDASGALLLDAAIANRVVAIGRGESRCA